MTHFCVFERFRTKESPRDQLMRFDVKAPTVLAQNIHVVAVGAPIRPHDFTDDTPTNASLDAAHVSDFVNLVAGIILARTPLHHGVVVLDVFGSIRNMLTTADRPFNGVNVMIPNWPRCPLLVRVKPSV